MTPVVTGEVNPAAFDDLVRLCVQLDRLRCHGTAAGTGAGDDAGSAVGAAVRGGTGGTGTRGSGPDGSGPEVPAAFRGRSREALEQAVIGKAVELLSGPGGLASFLRRRLFEKRLTGPSLPLDIGYSGTVPAGIRNAVRLRGGHCE